MVIMITLVSTSRPPKESVKPRPIGDFATFIGLF